MAVDTRDKRFSIMGLSQPVPSLYANPDGTIGTQDRAQLVFLYAGISLGGAPTTTVIDYGRGLMRGMFRGITR
jgi:hypothetical protein